MRTTARPPTGNATVPATAGSCVHGACGRGFGEPEVSPSPAAPGTKPRTSGPVISGVGEGVGADTTKIAAGAAVLTAAAVGGTLLLRRRASGAQRG
ncbi:hypothetical protein ABZ070_29135 [Streptomyces sp. NPDC006283]|uniref:hypothetical protein n=1 Tax=Streptomyces sp. NPDC006283 TaxID=3156741 RepID=UPI0033B8FE60